MSQTSLSFHNTISAKGAELDKFETRARSLEDQVLQMLYTTHTQGITRAQVINAFPQYSEVSCGRALSNLVTRDKVIRTKQMKNGNYGVNNSIYKLIER